MLQASGFKGQEINDISSRNLLFCEMQVSNKESDWMHRQQCQSKRPQVLINISQGDGIDWSHFGSPQGRYFHSGLIWKPYNLNGTVEISFSVNELI